jgi:methylmalonyl-CoA mutase
MDSMEKWVLLAKKELGVKVPFESLTKAWDKFEIKPYYDNSDLSFNINEVPERQKYAFGNTNFWHNLPEVDCAVPESNTVALNHLQNGADGIIFRVDNRTNPRRILAEVKPEFCFIGFECNEASVAFFEDLVEFISADKLDGVIFWNSKVKWLSVANLFKSYNSFRCFGITETGDGASAQLLGCVRNAIGILDSLTDYAFSPKTIFDQLAFTVNSSSDFFGDIIKVRALRILLGRVSMAYGLGICSTFIRVKVKPTVPQIYQPHGDLLANSFGSIAAISGSADAITVVTDSRQSDLHNRTARNISILLQQESKLDKVLDPFSGSYFIESLTNALVNEVWDKVSTER